MVGKEKDLRKQIVDQRVRAIVRKLDSLGYENMITRTSSGLDLCQQKEIDFF